MAAGAAKRNHLVLVVATGRTAIADSKEVEVRSNSDLTESDFIRAASLRSNGATWEQIRARLDVRTDSRVFYRYWLRHGIEHPPEQKRSD